MIDPLSLVAKLKNLKILVIGDTMLDHYLWGDVHRISPEAPVPVVNAIRDTYTAGGAANVALNLVNLGVSTYLIGHIAPDEAGRRLSGILSGKGVNLVEINHRPDTPTIIKTRVIIRNQQLCRIDRELSGELYRLDGAPDFQTKLSDVLDSVDAVIISDYAKGVITQTVVDMILAKAAGNPKLLVAIDPKPSRKLSFTGAGLLTPNRQEAMELGGINQHHYDEKYPLDEVCKRIYDLYKPKILVITLGSEGMAICAPGKVQTHLPTEAQEVFDVSGAGDTVIATLTASLAAGISPLQAAWLANGAAGCVVSHLGTVAIELPELQRWVVAHAAKFTEN